MKSVAQQWMQEGAEKLKPAFIKQGIEQGIRRVATKLLAEGVDVNLVARTTGLSVAQIEAIKQSPSRH